ncbi:hypothetical protein GUJ93_ZPchr0003g16458 [Zizania palustris]|uniref:HMA domain-containing protein n=1 Tax=Zizania palustris TaxID=103762 RepID=A0A8J5SUN5_ZIZPA|nr:hypothetical protein GUJ93_ZPchr0003g16458 [Zizania palustris]KAG8061926.1 hypothetical protein GUJ93_ZPchr0003g16458 [Zizania palustris]
MGEQVNNSKGEEGGKVEEKKEEAVPAAAEANKEAEEAAATAIKEEQAPPPPPPPVILGVELHCTGCAKRIRRCILRCKGVQGVEVDMAANQHCHGHRGPASPLRAPPGEDDAHRHRRLPAAAAASIRRLQVQGGPASAAVARPLTGERADDCGAHGVQTAETNFSAGKLTVTGTITGDKLADYIHRRTGKLATVVPPPLHRSPRSRRSPRRRRNLLPPTRRIRRGGTQPAAAEDGSKPKKEAGCNKEEEDTKTKPEPDEEKPTNKQQEEADAVVVDGFPPEEMMKRMMYWPPYSYKHYSYYHGGDGSQGPAAPAMQHHPCAINFPWAPQPPPPAPAPVWYNYMVERPPPAPQLFSDENPNACVIS